jgi:hypothetical protein
LVDAAKSSGKTYMLSENYCYMRDAVLVREMARKGLFGELYFGEGEYLHDVKYLHHNSDGSPTWRYFWQVGTNGSTYPTHSLGPVCSGFRPPIRKSASSPWCALERAAAPTPSTPTTTPAFCCANCAAASWSKCAWT